MTSSKTSNIQQLHIFYTPAVVVGGENLLSSAMGEECSKVQHEWDSERLSAKKMSEHFAFNQNVS